MKAKSLFLAVVASSFFWACSDNASPMVPTTTGEGEGEVAYSSDANGNQVPASASSDASGADQGSYTPDASCTPAGSPVCRIGALSVSGNKVVGANGQPAQLRGMSMFWDIFKEGTKYYNSSVVNWLTSDWKVSIVRAAMAFEENGYTPGGDYEGYLKNPSWNQQQVETIVDAAIANGIYVIIDLHSHWIGADDHRSEWPQAKAFFEAMATKYGKYPNVIYEIYNEPGEGVGWDKIKPYAETIIPAIRAIDPDNIIVVGTPGYSSKVDQVTALTGVTNVAYTFHFYASEEWHHNNYLPMVKTVANQLPLFVTEWGLSPASGDGAINTAWVEDFMTWMEGAQLSWAAWSICDKVESSAALVSNANSTGNWTEASLKQSGTYLRNKIRELNP